MRKVARLAVLAALLAGSACAPPVARPPSGAGLSCPGDRVVWVDTLSQRYYFEGDANFGTTKFGKFVCQRAAVGQGAREPRGAQ